MFHVFDGLFFFNSLGPYCKLSFHGYYTKFLGTTHRLPWGKRPVFIRIYRHIVVEDATEQSKRVLYIAETVLHEMVHAYEVLFVATSWELQATGKTGHGFAWQEIAYALEIAINDLLIIALPWKIDLGRKAAMMQEMEMCGANIILDATRCKLGILTGTKVTANWKMAWKPQNLVATALEAITRVKSSHTHRCNQDKL